MNLATETKFSSITRTQRPTHRDEYVKGCWKWLKGRRADDSAEGLWRVRDKLYDLGGYIERHPGGREWLILAKGTDITEAFEVFHLSSKPAEVLQKFYVRDAKEPRNYRLTFHHDGFFQTLKRRCLEKLKTIDVGAHEWRSKRLFDLFVLGWIFCACASMLVGDWIVRALCVVLSGVFACFMVNAGHNFIHKRNSWRMYGCHAALLNFREFRVFHAMSHHLYPNSVYDLEISIFEPFFEFMPIAKTKLRIVLNYLSIPYIYLFGFHSALYHRFLSLFQSERGVDMQIFYWDDLIGLCLYPLMFLTRVAFTALTNVEALTSLFLLDSFTKAIVTGNLVLISTSLVYNFIAFSVGHHGTEVTHEGDEFRSLDFGVYQLAATIDRHGAVGSLFMALTHYGEHILHHLLPSLDHSVLHHFRDILEQTCVEFKAEMKVLTMGQASLEMFRQLNRTTVHTLKDEEIFPFTQKKSI